MAACSVVEWFVSSTCMSFFKSLVGLSAAPRREGFWVLCLAVVYVGSLSSFPLEGVSSSSSCEVTPLLLASSIFSSCFPPHGRPGHDVLLAMFERRCNARQRTRITVFFNLCGGRTEHAAEHPSTITGLHKTRKRETTACTRRRSFMSLLACSCMAAIAKRYTLNAHRHAGRGVDSRWRTDRNRTLL